MKKIFVLLLSLLLFQLAFSQEKTTKVILKNGATVTGIIKEFNPASHIIISVAGFETKIDMNDVASVSENEEESSDQNDESFVVEQDDYPYPENYILHIGPYDVEMKLIPGDTYEMGFGGRGSVAMDSEPVHNVHLSSFYVNVDPLPRVITEYLYNKKLSLDLDVEYHPDTRKQAKNVVEKIAEATDLPVNLITEAQWEYIARKSPGLLAHNEVNYCLDYYGKYFVTETPQVDPKGPRSGNVFVLRKNSSSEGLYHRYTTQSVLMNNIERTVRFCIPAVATIKD